MIDKKLMMIIVSLACLALVGSAEAAPYNFNGFTVDVEAWVGSGSNETIMVVDWNKLDNGPATVSESHAFGYRWDGVQYESDMLAAFNNAGVLTITMGSASFGPFIENIGYNDTDDNETHLHIEPGSWSLASTSNPYARWGTWGDSEWDFNAGGVDQELLADGQYEGIDAVLYYSTMPDYANDQLDIPTPEPVSLSLVGFGALALLRRRGARA